MIQFPCTNLFDARIPILEEDEEEMFFVHHKWPGIKCNQLGAIYFDEEIYSMQATYPSPSFRTLKSPHAVLGTKEVVVYECYYGGDWKGKQFYHINGNPYDFTPDNLIPSFDHSHPRREEAKENKNRFIRDTLRRLVELEDRFTGEGISKYELYDFLTLPLWLRNARKIYKEAPLQPGELIYSNVKEKVESKHQQVLRLFDEGVAIRKIALEVGYSSKHSVSVIVKRYIKK